MIDKFKGYTENRVTKKTIKILISGGGTAGHINPAVAIANEIKNRRPKSKFLFVGAKGRMEMEKIPNAGYKIKGLWISGIKRKFTIDNLWFPFKLLSSIIKSKKIIKKFKPDIVVGTGGFVSGPILYVAASKKIPTLIQEQNLYPGITNKLLSKKANSICVAYDNLNRFFPKQKIKITGNPVRQDLLKIESKRKISQDFLKLDSSKKTILVMGGSQGARAINELIADSLEWLIKKRLQIVWQTGKLYFDEYKKYDALEGVQIHSFFDQMDKAYAVADFVISRAGAISISELCIVGKPTILIPSPNVSEDHQTKNALSLVEKKAVIILKEDQLDRFCSEFEKLLYDENLQVSLSKNIKKLAMPNATKDIVNEIERLIS